MNSILIVSSSIKGKNVLLDLLRAIDSRYDIKCVTNGTMAREEIQVINYDLVIINYPLKDETGDALACDISSRCNSNVVLLADSDNSQDIENKLLKYGVVTVSKPISRSIFNTAIKSAIANINKLNKLIEENNKLKKRLDEFKYVSKAKCFLIEYDKLSENEAHRYIEKKAMDTRTTKTQVAISIINRFKC